MNTVIRRPIEPPPALASRRGSVVVGCLVALVIVIAIALAGGIYVWMSWKGWAASITRATVREVLKESNLAEDQKQAITAEIETLTKDFEAGRVSFDDLRRVGEEIESSPLIPLAGVQLAKEKYIDGSVMSAEEKAASERTLQRFARGVHERKITPAEEKITDAIKPIVRLKPGNNWELKDNPTRLELDQFLANCKAEADAAQIPDEPFVIDFAAELRKIIATARNPGSSPPTPAELPAAPTPDNPAPPPGGGG
ncbi:MAG: hypothetical protein ACKVU4_13060 [Phycisphaerales bacterium]